MYGILRTVLLGFTLFFLSPVASFGQQPGTVKEALKGMTGRQLVDELRLREAAAIKGATGVKSWAANVKADSLTKNVYAGFESTALKSKLTGSALKNFSSTALFQELNRRAVEKGIFGIDDRKDLFAMEAERAELLSSGSDTAFHDGALRNANAVCCLVEANKLSATATGTLRMATVPFSDSRHDTIKLCPLERFSTQPVGAFCTGFLVAPDVVVTAGHCVAADTVGSIRFAFGYRMTNAMSAVTTFPLADVYSGAEVLGRALNAATGEDWAVVRLDRPVQGVAPLKFRKTGKAADAQAIYVVGFPSGLPCKVAAGAKVNANVDAFVFTANLDTYGGNSGSPVFNQTTHEVEGILVRGGQDFEFVTDTLSGCIKSVALADAVGNEQCTRATIFASKVPNP